MVLIPPPTELDLTLVAMKKVIADKANGETRRKYIGASSIGKPCARQLYYEYNGYERKPFPPEAVLRFEDGHRTEALTIERLQMVPDLELWTRDEAGNQIGFSDFDGQFKGHVDGIIRGISAAPKNPHVLEIKCCAEKRYREFQNAKAKFGSKGALKEFDKTYFAQAQVYCHYFKLDRHYLVVATAGGRDYDSCRTEYDREAAEYYIDRAKKLIDARSAPPRISDKPDFWLCRFCDFNEICHQ